MFFSLAGSTRVQVKTRIESEVMQVEGRASTSRTASMHMAAYLIGEQQQRLQTLNTILSAALYQRFWHIGHSVLLT